MDNESVIPYDLVAIKMNFWYKTLKQNWPHEAEETKKEIEKLIDQMEQNQEVLIYYSLLEFRHRLQFDYLRSGAEGDLDSRYKKFREIRTTNDLEGMLEYYYHFFAGMYHFRQKELLHALTYYKNAEFQLRSMECDEVEKAEFYFKVSEVYYHMKQTILSMNYASKAYNIYKHYPTYGERIIQCQFILAGNCLDQMCPEKAMPFFNKALNEARQISAAHLIGSSLLNIGLCYDQLGEFETSKDYFQNAIGLYKEENHSYLPKAIFNLAYVKAKLKEYSSAYNLYLEGTELAEKNKDIDMLSKLNMVKGLYFLNDLDMVRESFKFFKETGKYADLEEYGLIAAQFLEAKDQVHDALEFYRATIDAKRQIQRGVLLH
ncbi:MULTISPECIES: Rap family tetratricopeptide repeat protein [Bacillus]|uniref:Rap family tetratricopeptide repeat protein n=1 Tax=Bacillus TaxID=1386 RepID=UPI00041A642E|nr:MULTISPECIES: Rap family tetratricopeptide repeat protein [Bacillus]QHZ47038.1 tetratricopeptide repeat protein [Bacillus sp. NSP9.1]WFA07123.1 tetratricopeptide repeat protein [Bacillus sp. HSf4]